VDKLEESWQKNLSPEFEKPYMNDLRIFLKQERSLNKTVYPNPDQYFSALNLTPFDQVKVVILGQDPYHGEGQAHGLCFSVAPDMRIPPSLVNIYKELHHDLGLDMPAHGCLVSWAKQGVLLLNSVLTVEKGQAASHQRKGWEVFTDAVIRALNDEKEHVVFILWGSYAQKKGAFIDETKHLVIRGVHPSPLSAHRGFFHQNHFSQTNNYLQQFALQPIEWALPDINQSVVQFEQAEILNQEIYADKGTV